MSASNSRDPFPKEADGRGAFVRQRSAFRDWVKADGSTPYAPEAGRYHLYVSLACPWACRAVVVRRLKGLEDAIGMTVVDPLRDARGWRFGDGSHEKGEVDPLNGWTYLSEGYQATDPAFEGRVTVPTLWDTSTGRVVNNESADIIRMLNVEFDASAANPGLDLEPADLRDEIDRVNERVYDGLNNGVYRSGFASTQAAYTEAVAGVFETLDWLEELLGERRYVAGDRMTLADWRLFTTLVRFDAVYHGHFKCNARKLVEHPNVWAYTRELFQVPGVAATVDLDHITRHYYVTHTSINPTGIVPIGPVLDFEAPHGRAEALPVAADA